MISTLASAFILLVPLIISGVIHMLAVKADLLSFLKKPIHERLFGANKTYRGFVIMPLATIPGVMIAQMLEPVFPEELLKISVADADVVILGFLLGVGYLISELPNSFMKRKLGIRPGMLPDSKRIFFLIHDQVDSALGCVLVYYFFIKPPVDVIVVFVFLGLFIHLIINFLLFLLGIRKRPV